MKALVKAKPEVGLWMQDVPEPQMGDNDVLIKIQHTSICGTDVHIYEWDEWAQKTVPVPMHNVWREDVAEPALTIEEVLANAPQKSDGQFVIQAVLDE